MTDEPVAYYTVFNEAEDLGSAPARAMFIVGQAMADMNWSLRTGSGHDMEKSAMHGCWGSKKKHRERAFGLKSVDAQLRSKLPGYPEEALLPMLKLFGRGEGEAGLGVPSVFAISAWKSEVLPYYVAVAQYFKIRVFNFFDPADKASWDLYLETLQTMHYKW